MAVKPDASGYENFSDVTERLDEIVAAVRNKDTSLECSLDLFDEAIALGTRAVDLVDKASFSPEERERLANPDATQAALSARAGDTAAAGAGAEGKDADGSQAEPGEARPEDARPAQPGEDAQPAEPGVDAQSGDSSAS